MPLPAALIGAGAQFGGTLAGAMLGRKKTPNPPDYSGLIAALNGAGAEQRNMISSQKSQLAPLTSSFVSNRNALTSGFTKNVAGMGDKYVKDAADVTGERTALESTAGRRRILSAQPDLNQGLREALAQSGLNRGGALVAGQTKIGQSLGTQIGEMESGIAQQNVAAKAQAIKDAYAANVNAAQAATGLDADTMQIALNSGRQDIIDEIHALIQESQNRNNTIAGIQAQGLNDAYASRIADATKSQDLIAALVGSGANLAGQYANYRWGK